MKKYILCFFTIVILNTKLFAQKVFSVDYSNQAEVKVFVVKYESQSDLKVYKVKYENQILYNILLKTLSKTSKF